MVIRRKEKRSAQRMYSSQPEATDVFAASKDVVSMASATASSSSARSVIISHFISSIYENAPTKENKVFIYWTLLEGY